jgi:hypothetical protein
MPRLSQPAALVAFKNRSGSISYRVTASISGNQRKKCCANLAEAEAIQRLWESERTSEAAVLRRKVTWLTPEEITTRA